MEEVLPGVYHWSVRHPKIGVAVGCHFVSGSGTAIDPLLPEEGIEWFEERPPQRVVLSNRHHLRHAEQLSERFRCPILCNEAGLHEFAGGPQVEGFAFGDRLADDVTALAMDAICPDDTALRIDAGDGALLFADSLIHYGGVGFVSDRLIGDDAEAVKQTAAQRATALLDEPFDSLLFAHGTPLIGGGKEALRAFADRYRGQGA
jgi:glyoxylase-like metal-dependent hydrolase (beta-lactamase superfamily II)